MKKLVDVSGKIYNGMWKYDFIPRQEIKYMERELGWAPEGNFYAEELYLSSHTSTYLETPAHLFSNSPTIDEIPLQEFIREVLFINVPKNVGEMVTLREVKKSLFKEREEVNNGESVIISTGWDKKWGNDCFIKESPFFHVEVVDWLLARDISLLGGDIPSFDSLDHPQRLIPKLLKEGVLIIAPLVKLQDIPVTRAKLYCFPLKIEGACASPCRAICEFPI